MATTVRAAIRDRVHAMGWLVVLCMGALTYYGFSRGLADGMKVGESGNGTAVPQGNLIFASTEANQELLQRMQARDGLARDVVAGRLSLTAAAAEFQRLDQQSPTFDVQRFRRFAPGRTDSERYGRLVIAGVEALLADTPDRADILDRLHRELSAGHGDVRP